MLLLHPDLLSRCKSVTTNQTLVTQRSTSRQTFLVGRLLHPCCAHAHFEALASLAVHYLVPARVPAQPAHEVHTSRNTRDSPALVLALLWPLSLVLYSAPLGSRRLICHRCRFCQATPGRNSDGSAIQLMEEMSDLHF